MMVKLLKSDNLRLLSLDLLAINKYEMEKNFVAYNWLTFHWGQKSSNYNIQAKKII